jgi:hypothetical protein
MKIDVKTDMHMTTCHHSSVKCRPRTNDYNIEGFNISGWTQEEKVKIARKSFFSLLKFVDFENISIIDDGSDLPTGRALISFLGLHKLATLYSFPHRGSSFGLNDYFSEKQLDNDTLICHFEDDHIYFNPENLDWKQTCYHFLKEHKDIAVLSFKSGFPTDPSFPDYKGAWGPIGWRESKNDLPPAFLFKFMGNSHHIMLYETYKKFLPLQGSSGSCESYMCKKLVELGMFCAELQAPIYAFHSHCLKRELPNPVTSKELNMCARGREYGIVDMFYHITNNNHISYSYYTSPQKEVSYDFGV